MVNVHSTVTGQRTDGAKSGYCRIIIVIVIDGPCESPPLVKTPMTLPAQAPASISCPSLPGVAMTLALLLNSTDLRLLALVGSILGEVPQKGQISRK